MSRKHAVLASSLTICSASWALNPDCQQAYGMEELAEADSGPSYRTSQKPVYNYLKPIIAMAEGDLAARVETRAITYTVKEGDILSKIANFYNVPYLQVANYNRLADPEQLRIGQILNIPISRKWIYLKTGDNVDSLLKEHKLTKELFFHLNPFYRDGEKLASKMIALPHKLKPAPIKKVPKLRTSKNVVQRKISKQKSAPLPAKLQPRSSYSFQWPIRGKITSNFGWRQGSRHQGIDIWSSARSKASIKSALGGVVVKSEYHGAYGNMVIIDHGGGWETLYAHLSRLLVTKGQRIGTRQIIGYMGRTGDATGHHLHFEVRKGGSLLNPLSVLP